MEAIARKCSVRSHGIIKPEKSMVSFGLGDILTQTNLVIFISMAGIKDSGLDTVSTTL